MAVISITVVPSTKQYISGIPATVTITTNLPSVIFYTIDGSEPTTASEVYVSAITMPRDLPSVNLRILASNGSDVDGTVNVVYSPNWTNNKVSHAKVTILNPNRSGTYCGSRGETQRALYSQPASYTVDQAGVTNTASDGYGYNPTIYPMRGSDVPIPIHDLKLTDTDAEGRTGPGIGDLPKVTTIYVPPPPATTDANKATFNPKAMVIYQDGTKPDENDYIINRQFFDCEDYEKAYSGSKYNSSIARGGESAPRGSLLRYLYNPTENTITFYYRDANTNRWIISKEAYKPLAIANAKQGTFLGRYMLPTNGNGFVFKWNLFKRTALI